MGGTLSHPFERFPQLFGEMKIFERHPYLLRALCFGSHSTSR